MNSIYAKSESQNSNEITLVEHNNDLLNTYEKIKHKIGYKNIQDIIKDYDLEEILLKLFVMHDLGKINIKFQNKIKKNFELLEGKEIRHNILSGAFSKKLLEDIKTNDEILFNVMIKSIMYHHGHFKKYYNLNISDVEKSLYKDIEEAILDNNDYDLSDIEKQLSEVFKKDIKIDENILDYDFMNYFNKDFSNEGNLEVERENDYKLLYIFLKGYVNLVDHLASSKIKDYEYFFSKSNDYIQDKIRKFLAEKSKNKDQIVFNDIQKRVLENLNKNIITKGFTGSGKTVADHLWTNERKIFLVPTKISGENFYLDALKIYGEENVGILHGDINLYNIENKEIETRINLKLSDINLAHNLAKPYIISTIDQILLSLFKYPNYEKLLVNIYNSKITVDEVHLLNPKMFVILILFMDFTSKHFNVKYHLMTATMPKIYQQILESKKIMYSKTEDNYISFDTEFENNIQKNISNDIKKVKIDLIKEEKIKSILSKNKNKKILIVKNTIDESIKTYEKLYKQENFEVDLLHSRFKFEDKQGKYNKLNSIKEKDNKGIIWITTQLVETSLDLDFDILITDLAPIDSLIQRMGRCNRHNTKEYGEVYILENEKMIPYDKNLKDPSLKIIKNKKYKGKELGEKDRNQMLEEYYDEKKVFEYYKTNIEKAVFSIKRIWDIQKESFNYKDLIFNYDPYLNIVDNKMEAEKLFRDNTNINALLEKDFKEINEDFKTFNKKYLFNSIPISTSFYFKAKSIYGIRQDKIFRKNGVFVLDDSIVEYTKEKGLKLLKNKETDNFI
ncbi:CRISPR-associated Cas3 family helicase [Oceanotoga teriensis]|uniref:CRISPR-associated Cas3 family helicase n=1 Tax=Oceanotoga teriensis TaxID=515440 RepID=A0AA45C6Y8_9BACT|nr:CRISPR-associated helicase Cas3' [Oceanotoga teriensis]PWJ93307.1 CRISPR-associated Cas3 family helicase [Oceanotoga teriensis]